MSPLVQLVVTGVVSSTFNVTSIVQCGRTVCETEEVCEHILLEPTCRKHVGAVCNKSMFVDIPTTRSTVSPSATLVTTYRLTSSAARDTASPTVSLAETTASTASTVKVGTPSTLAPPSGARGTPTAGPVYTERRYPTASPHLEPRGSPTAAPPGLRKKRAVKETQCVINAICVASSDVYRCRCQTGYTADRNHTCHKDSKDSGAAPMTESKLALSILCGYFIMLMYTDTCF